MKQIESCDDEAIEDELSTCKAAQVIFLQF